MRDKRRERDFRTALHKPLWMDALRFSLRQQLTRSQKLCRQLEPSPITDNKESARQYNDARNSKLTPVYATGIKSIFRARSDRDNRQRALDLACGPGYFTLDLAKYLGYAHVTGMDLSPEMLSQARMNADTEGIGSRAEFLQGDITHLNTISSDSMDLSTFTDAAHHLETLQHVRSVLLEMNRVTKPSGLIMIMDLCRLRTRALTESYISVLGRDYEALGLSNFYEDFYNSMYAAFTWKELRSAIPTASNRQWCHLVPRGLPAIQMIIGLPAGHTQPFVRSSNGWEGDTPYPVPKNVQSDLKILDTLFAFASRTYIPAGLKNPWDVDVAVSTTGRCDETQVDNFAVDNFAVDNFAVDPARLGRLDNKSRGDCAFGEAILLDDCQAVLSEPGYTESADI